MSPFSTSRFRSFALLSAICILIATLNVSALNTAAQEKGDAGAGTTNGTITNQTIVNGQVPDESITSETIARELSKISAATDLDEALRGTLEKLYQDTSGLLKQLETSRSNSANYQGMSGSVAEQTLKVRLLLEAPARQSEKPGNDISLEDLRQRLAMQQAEVERIRKEFELLSVEPTRRQQRVAEIPAKQDENRKDLSGVQEELKKEAPADELQLATRARKVNLLVKKQTLEAQLEELADEKAAYKATADLLPLQRDLAKKNLDAAQATLNSINEAIAKVLGDEAQKLLEESRQLLKRTDDPLKPAAEANVSYAEKLNESNSENVDVAEQLQNMKARIETLQLELKTTKSRVEAVGLTETLGYMLREKRAELLKERSAFRPNGDTREEIRQLQLSTFKLEDAAARMNDMPRAIQQELGDMIEDSNSASQYDSQMQEILEQRKTLVEKSIKAQHDLFQNKVAYDTAQHNYVRDVNEYITFIDKHVLWIRSSPPISAETFQLVPQAVNWLVDWENWSRLTKDLWQSVRTAPAKHLLSFVGVLLLFGFHKRFRRIVKQSGKEALDRKRISIVPTVNSMLATVFLATVWVAPVFLAGWILMGRPQNNEFTIAIGRGLISVASFVAPLEVLRNIWRDLGLAEAHFGWGKDLSRFFRKHLQWFFAITIPALFVLTVLQFQGNEQLKNSLGRLAAIVLFTATAFFLHIIFRPEGVFFSRIKQTFVQSRLYSIRRILHPLIVGVPIFLALLTIVGYYYTAFELGGCLYETTSTITFLLITLGLVMRALYIRRRALIRAEAQERLLAMKMESASSDSGNLIAETVGIDIQEESDTKINSLSEQSRRVVMFTYVGLAIAACWIIWSDVLPALGILDRVTVWTVTIAERIEHVTLADLFYSTISVFVTYVAVRNVPGLLELVVLRHSALDSGARYAVTTIFRYALIVIGLMAALRFLSIPWSQYGWLVAAVTVGLGFGLQEIVANFVSGLILLLERPVRVGDVVTVDGISGMVSRIQMRATTITNWDRQELIVPNKDLITGKLLNWSLSNVINRIVLNVGVAYGSDVEQVRSIIQGVVASHEKVLEDPAPLISFEQMGDNALGFVIRCYLSGLDHRISVTHELNSGLIKALTEVGISIPFPQRDLHVKAIPQELIDRLSNSEKAGH